MGIVVSMLMITVGAIMRFAVTAQGSGFSVHMTGVILMVVGILGAVLSIGFWASWGGFGGLGRRPAVVTTHAPMVVTTPAPTVVTTRAIVTEDRPSV
jgi:hypothetical protein